MKKKAQYLRKNLVSSFLNTFACALLSWGLVSWGLVGRFGRDHGSFLWFTSGDFGWRFRWLILGFSLVGSFLLLHFLVFGWSATFCITDSLLAFELFGLRRFVGLSHQCGGAILSRLSLERERVSTNRRTEKASSRFGGHFGRKIGPWLGPWRGLWLGP